MQVDDSEFLMAHGASRFLRPERYQELKRKGAGDIVNLQAVIDRILTFALELKVIIIIFSAFLAQNCGVQLVRDLKGLTPESSSSHGFGTAPHTTWP